MFVRSEEPSFNSDGRQTVVTVTPPLLNAEGAAFFDAQRNNVGPAGLEFSGDVDPRPHGRGYSMARLRRSERKSDHHLTPKRRSTVS